MADVDGPTWKVGQLARLTGLTVRTLHHYDQVGLLCPSARTPSGHRLYDDQDVRRLYRIVALRELGLPLEVIGDLLTGEPDLADLLRDHLAHVDQQLAAIQALRRRPRTPGLAVRHAGRQQRDDAAAKRAVNRDDRLHPSCERRVIVVTRRPPVRPGCCLGGSAVLEAGLFYRTGQRLIGP